MIRLNFGSLLLLSLGFGSFFTYAAPPVPAAVAPPVAASAPTQAPAVPSPTPVPRPEDTSGEGTVSQPNQTADANAAESLLKMRDPFKRPDTAVEDSAPKSDLESYPSHQFNLVGVMTGPREIRAILRSPSGKTFFVKRGEHIGLRKGIIDKISPMKILVQEKIVNVLGQAENVTTEIKLDLSTKGGMSLSPIPGVAANPPKK